MKTDVPMKTRPRPRTAALAALFILIAAAPAAAQSAQSFIIRTRPAYSADALAPEKDKLLRAGYHPSVKEERVQGRDDSVFYLELGVFDNLDDALPLFVTLRQEGFQVFIFSSGAPLPATETPILPAALAQRFFPEMKKSGVDQLELIMRIADGRKPPGGDAAASTPPTGSTPVGIARAPLGDSQRRDSPIRRRLRDYAWRLREKGYSVFVEGESEITGDGVLIGVFEAYDDAVDLAGEMSSYGYSMKILKETRGGTRHYVYVDTAAEAAAAPQPAAAGSNAAAADPLDFLLELNRPGGG